MRCIVFDCDPRGLRAEFTAKWSYHLTHYVCVWSVSVFTVHVYLQPAPNTMDRRKIDAILEKCKLFKASQPNKKKTQKCTQCEQKYNKLNYIN